MTPAEFFDKENGTTHALTRLPLSDSARNELMSGAPSNGTYPNDDDSLPCIGCEATPTLLRTSDGYPVCSTCADELEV